MCQTSTWPFAEVATSCTTLGASFSKAWGHNLHSNEEDAHTPHFSLETIGRRLLTPSSQQQKQKAGLLAKITLPNARTHIAVEEGNVNLN